VIRIYPRIESDLHCPYCKTIMVNKQLAWQGVHICADAYCNNCNESFYSDLQVGQGVLQSLSIDKTTGRIFDNNGVAQSENWYTTSLKALLTPTEHEINIEVEKRKEFRKVVILNTVDFIYGHSLLQLLNLQRIIKYAPADTGIVVVVQPMMRWLVPKESIAEVWTVHLSFNDVGQYYASVSQQLNAQLKRFDNCFISNGYVIPTNEAVNIEMFTNVKPFTFNGKGKKRITFVWREDAGRLWVRNIYILKGFKKIGISRLLLPLHHRRVNRLMTKIKKKLDNSDNYQFTVAGLGKYGKFPGFINDCRVSTFSEDIERNLCRVYAESEMVIGVHGSSMLLPSAHAGMAVSLMPSKRWGNYGEDLLIKETDARVALFQKRILPMDLNLSHVTDVCSDMLKGREYFMRKFVHSEEI
jgi:hypothetical protein